MKNYLFCMATVIVMFGCNAENKEYANDTQEVAIINDELAAKNTAPKIVKTANARFRVKDVQTTKEELTRVIKNQGGTLAEFSITSNVQETKKVKYSVDSLKEITSYQQDGLLIAKIPSERLDEFTNSIAKMAVFVDHQSLKMDDKSIIYLANKLKAENRVEAVKQIKNIGKKKNSNVESSLYIKDDYVDKNIENLTIENDVKYSTITLNFYQDLTVNTIIVANDNLNAYQPGFFKRLGLNLLDGWMIFTEFLLFVSRLWALFLSGFLMYSAYRYYCKYRKLRA